MSEQDYEEMCIGIYLEYHISQLKELSIMELEYWHTGQELYTKNKATSK